MSRDLLPATLSAASALQAPSFDIRHLENRLFAAEDVFADLDEAGDLIDGLTMVLRKLIRIAEVDPTALDGADLFADLARLLTAVRWGALALAKASAGERLIAAHQAREKWGA